MFGYPDEMYQSNRSLNIPPPRAYPGHLTSFPTQEGGNLMKLVSPGAGHLITTHPGFDHRAALSKGRLPVDCTVSSWLCFEFLTQVPNILPQKWSTLNRLSQERFLKIEANYINSSYPEDVLRLTVLDLQKLRRIWKLLNLWAVWNYDSSCDLTF